MSKKKSYMNHKNVLLENKLINAFKFLVGLNQLKKQKLSSKEKQALKNPKIQKPNKEILNSKYSIKDIGINLIENMITTLFI